MSKGMVICKNVGRMGNFLFQTAMSMSYAWDHEMDFTVPQRTKDPFWNPIYLGHLANPRYNPDLSTVHIREKTHGFQKVPFEDVWRESNIFLEGYWQTEKYFVQYRDKVISAFGFPWEHWKGRVSVHVRRTDYLELKEKHPEVTKAWYEQAMAKFHGFQFVFFSDDINWCKANFGDRTNCVFSEGKTEQQDLIRMSWCEHHICSASTFSWWGAWLDQNPRKWVIIPKDWFQPGYRKTDTSDIVPFLWERQ